MTHLSKSLYVGVMVPVCVSRCNTIICSYAGGVPNSRWLVNFDYDLLDGLVLAACLGAYCPFLISTHFIHMYTKPETAEQCLHNALKVRITCTYLRYVKYLP